MSKSRKLRKLLFSWKNSDKKLELFSGIAQLSTMPIQHYRIDCCEVKKTLVKSKKQV